MTNRKAVKAWGIKNRGGNLHPIAYHKKVVANSSENFGWPGKVVRVEIKEIRSLPKHKLLIMSNGTESFFPTIICNGHILRVGHSYRTRKKALPEGRKMLKKIREVE